MPPLALGRNLPQRAARGRLRFGSGMVELTSTGGGFGVPGGHSPEPSPALAGLIALVPQRCGLLLPGRSKHSRGGGPPHMGPPSCRDDARLLDFPAFPTSWDLEVGNMFCAVSMGTSTSLAAPSSLS